MENQQKLVELGNRLKGKIELPSLDISEYVGKKVKIAKVQEFEGNYGYYIRIETEVVAEIEGMKDDDGKQFELKASRMFGLQTDAEGNIGWGENSKLGVFLEKKNVESYRDLIGVEVVTTSVTNATDKKDYLSFN